MIRVSICTLPLLKNDIHCVGYTIAPSSYSDIYASRGSALLASSRVSCVAPEPGCGGPVRNREEA